MVLEISELLLPAIAAQILQAIKELVCHTFNNKKIASSSLGKKSDSSSNMS
jgi:hypothetical protein